MRTLLTVIAMGFALCSPERVWSQGRLPFAIQKRASPNPVVAGGELTYTITLRSIADEPQRDVVVLDRLSDRVQVLYYGVQGEGRWIAGVKDERQTVLWIAQEPLAPGTTVTFTIVVRVADDARGPLVNDDYGVGIGKAEVALQGAVVRTDVIVPTPISTATPTPTRTPLPTPVKQLATRRTLPSATPSPTRAKPTPTPPLPSPTTEGEPARATHFSLWVPILVGGGISLVLAIVLTGRFLHKRG